MWVEIDKDIFQSSEFKVLNYLYQILSWSPSGSIPRYNVFVDLEKVKNTENYKKLKGIEVKFDECLETQFDNFVTSNAKKDYKITQQKKDNYFNIEEAITFFVQPVSIIVENNKNDSCFITAIIHHFDVKTEDEKYVVREHLKNGWIKFENAGGCTNVKNFITAFLSVFKDLALKNNREPSDYFRGLIILDSDKEYPSQPQLPKYVKLINSLNTKGINCIHILEKRMMENYMPDEVFKELKTLYSNKDRYKDLVAWINVYLNLNAEQKDFLNIKDGFSPKHKKDETGNRIPIKVEILNLFNIPKKEFDILDEGFKYEGWDFKNQFALLFGESKKESTKEYDKETKQPIVNEQFTNNVINKSTLNKRCNSIELQVIFDKIKELL